MLDPALVHRTAEMFLARPAVQRSTPPIFVPGPIADRVVPDPIVDSVVPDSITDRVVPEKIQKKPARRVKVAASK